MYKTDPIISDCICCWFDLLGYGKPFIDANWDLKKEGCKKNYERIRSIKSSFLGSFSVCKSGTKMVINDGFANTIDFDTASLSSYDDVLLFLEGAISDYTVINHTDKRNGFPGVRGVISSGHRFSYDQANMTIDLSTNRNVAYYPTEFQMNTAFSKANLMEGSGKRANLRGSNLFFDISILSLLKQASSSLGIATPKVTDCNERLLIQIYNKAGWFADIYVDSTAILYGKCNNYDNYGINTKLYKFIQMNSIVDDVSFEASLQQAVRLSKTEEE